MSEELGRKVVRLMIGAMICLLLVVAYVFYQSYEGRANVVTAQRAACERGKKDRNANAEGWRIAQAARNADGQTEVARKYSKIAAGLERRGRINCEKAFPKAGLIP